MKKFLLVILILLLGFGGYILYDNYYNKGIPKLTIEDSIINIDDITIYGTHLNMHGNLIEDNNLDLVLYNGNFIKFDINNTGDGFNLSNYINEGIDLEKLPIGKYVMLLRSTIIDENNKELFKYYALNNTTEYKKMTYYTFSNVGNKIIIGNDADYNSLMFNVTKNSNDNIYDVVIDPGHGGMDSGANKNGIKEADYTMKIATNLKEQLEQYGVKVKLTRVDGELSLDETLPDYGLHGRAVINHEVNAKYLFSIHLNSNSSSNVNGLEVYTAGGINYDFAKRLADNIVNNANTSYSTNKINKVYDGVYTRMFTDNDITVSKKDALDRGRTPYDITVKSNYYYMIRETGGIMTGAYVDNRNEPKVMANPYYDSNIGSESYLLELAYLTNKDDFNNIDKNMSQYTKAIADSFKKIYINQSDN